MDLYRVSKIFGFVATLALLFPAPAGAMSSRSQEAKHELGWSHSAYENDPQYVQGYSGQEPPSYQQRRKPSYEEGALVRRPLQGRRKPSYEQEVADRHSVHVPGFRQARSPASTASSEGWHYDTDYKTMPQKRSGFHLNQPVVKEPANRSYASVQHHTNKVPAEKAMIQLKNGNQRFIQGRMRKPDDGVSGKDRLRLLAGQSPSAVVVASSDSRVSPELVFDQRLGEIYVVRSLGPSLDAAVIASIEYAIARLGVQLVVIMGNENSSGVEAALQAMADASSGSPHFDRMVADIQPRLASYFRRPASSGLVRESTANVRGLLKDLIRRSPIIRSRVGSGSLQLRSALYHMDTGVVDFH